MSVWYPHSALNEMLYDKLAEVFKPVRVINAGYSVEILETTEWKHGAVRRQSQVLPGTHEEYAVPCPFCRDWKPRLHFHYQWGNEDYTNGQKMLHLVKCHNEDCLRDHSARQRLYNELFTEHWDIEDRFVPVTPDLLRRSVGGNPLGRARKGKAARNQELPSAIKRNRRDKLPEPSYAIIHEAVPDEVKAYLSARRFDIHELWARWRVSYCDGTGISDPQLWEGRIVAPVYFPPESTSPYEPVKLAGWAARLARDNSPGERTPKYLFSKGIRKSELLYGWPGPIHGGGPIVVVEGMTDVWRLGCNAVALLGKVASVRQQELLIRMAAGHPLVILLDVDARSEAETLVRSLRARRKDDQDVDPVMLATLPQGVKDVAELSREEAWKLVATTVHSAVRNLGVNYDDVAIPKHAMSMGIVMPKLLCRERKL